MLNWWFEFSFFSHQLLSLSLSLLYMGWIVNNLRTSFIWMQATQLFFYTLCHTLLYVAHTWAARHVVVVEVVVVVIFQRPQEQGWRGHLCLLIGRCFDPGWQMLSFRLERACLGIECCYLLHLLLLLQNAVCTDSSFITSLLHFFICYLIYSPSTHQPLTKPPPTVSVISCLMKRRRRRRNLVITLQAS